MQVKQAAAESTGEQPAGYLFISLRTSYSDFFFELGLRGLELLLRLRLVLGERVEVELEVVHLALQLGVLAAQLVALCRQLVLAARQLFHLDLHPLQLLVQPVQLRLRVLLPTCQQPSRSSSSSSSSSGHQY